MEITEKALTVALTPWYVATVVATYPFILIAHLKG